MRRAAPLAAKITRGCLALADFAAKTAAAAALTIVVGRALGVGV